ncbi:inositol monophosphatase family protein [Acinetobacter indicus]
MTIDTLRKSYKNHSFLGQEFGLQEGKGHNADWCWVIDPLDGTLRLHQRFPAFLYLYCCSAQRRDSARRDS